MKYVPASKREDEGVMSYADRLARERIEHVAGRLHIQNIKSKPTERLIGEILDEMTEFMCSKFSTGQWPKQKERAYADRT